MKKPHPENLLGFEIAQTLEYMIKLYKQAIGLSKIDKNKNIYKKELTRIIQTHKDLTGIPNYNEILFDVSDCNNKAKNLMTSSKLQEQINKYHELRRNKAKR